MFCIDRGTGNWGWTESKREYLVLARYQGPDVHVPDGSGGIFFFLLDGFVHGAGERKDSRLSSRFVLI